MTTLRLAVGGPPEALRKGLGGGVGKAKPALLVSYAYIDLFDNNREHFDFRDWVMDSGAFSAWKSGKVIDVDRYIADCEERLASDPQLTEVFALDVVGDWRGTMRNVERSWAKGVEAIPTFHVGTPFDVLESLARDYPKIALGGMVGYSKKKSWLDQCFARVWPKRLHGFGVMGEDVIMSFPFESVDASNWELAPCRFGRWPAFGGKNLKIRGSEQNLRPEVERILKLEKKVKWRWRKQLAQLQSEESSSAPATE